MTRHERERLERAERALRNLVSFRESLLTNPGVACPAGLDERIRQRAQSVRSLKALLGVPA